MPEPGDLWPVRFTAARCRGRRVGSVRGGSVLGVLA